MLGNIKGFWEPLRALLDHMEQLQFIRPGLMVKYLVADQVKEILPKLKAAAAAVSEAETQMKVPLDRT
jgi:predicted Rossmann-fold nucleotide-binding protein